MDALVQHLLVEQNVNMLDRTKCSVTARNIYNYLTGNPEAMALNNNLVSLEPNWAVLPAELRKDEDRVFYCHLDHITGETSHYFILVKKGSSVLLLQSAVFEYSIADWLHLPDEEGDALERELSVLEEEVGGADDPYTALRNQMRRQQMESVKATRQAVLNRIKTCRWSGNVVLEVEEFLRGFYAEAAEFEGVWSSDPVALEQKCAAYARTFACLLRPDTLRGHLSNDKNAVLKWVSAPLSVGV